jgi:hypothetical protein
MLNKWIMLENAIINLNDGKIIQMKNLIYKANYHGLSFLIFLLIIALFAIFL